MAQALNLEQGSQLWLQFREKHIGSSDIPVIMGLSPWKDVHTLWMEKTGRQEEGKTTFAMQVGKDKEDEARQLYLLITGCSLAPNNQWVFEHENGFCSASTDGVVVEDSTVLEIKCSERTYKLARLGKIEEHYKCQCQWHLMLSQRKKCDFIAYSNGEYKLLEIFPDIKFQQQLLEKAIWFWNLVTNEIEPEKPKDKSELNDSFEWYLESAGLIDAQNFVAPWLEKIDRYKNNLKIIAAGKNMKGNGIIVYQTKGKQTIEWNLVREKFELTDEKLEPFTKVGQPYSVVKQVV